MAGRLRMARTESLIAAMALLCLPLAWAHMQDPHSAPAPHAAASAKPATPRAGRAAARPTMHYGTPAPGNVPSGVRPAYPGPPALGPGYNRPYVPGHTPPADLPAGHLGSWLQEHRNLPANEQERVLRNDPSFRRLPPTDQQRLAEQLHQVNGLTPDQRQRRLARTEMLEHLPPAERMQVERSFRVWPTLPLERQTIMKNAFRDLRNVPPEQRQTVLDSARYQGVFNEQERSILRDFLRVEPYQPQR